MSYELKGLLHRLLRSARSRRQGPVRTWAPFAWLTRWTSAPVTFGLLLVALMAAAQGYGLRPVDRLGLQLFDIYHRAMPRAYEDAPVRVIDIDEESIRRLGQWPWPRSEIARLTDQLGKAGAAVIAFDIVFSEPDRTSPARIATQLQSSGADEVIVDRIKRLPDHDEQLAARLRENRVVLGYFLVNDRPGPAIEPKSGLALSGSPPERHVTRFTRAIESLPALDAAAAGKGFVSLSADGDGIVRQLPLVAWQGGQLVPAFSLEALRVAQGAGAIIVKTSDASGELAGASADVVSIKVGDIEIPTTASGHAWLHYTRPAARRVIPAWQVLSGDMPPHRLSQEVGGRIVLVGAGATGLRDLISTPLRSRELGVIAHAQAIEQAILGQGLLRPDWAPGLERALVLALGIGLALLLPGLGAVRGAVVGAAVIGIMAAGSWAAFARFHYLLDPTWPVATLLMVYLAQTAMIFYREERRRAYIHSAFDRYLSPEMVRRIAASPDRLELGGEERDMTVLFCDVRNFSRISEGLSPRAVIRFLIDLLTPMCDVLLARQATIDKFIGDAIVAFWNAPLDDLDQHRNAARAALEMVARLGALNREGADGKIADWPGEVRIGIGLNAGLCCVGNMGSAQRLSYSLIGDTVNLASRIEGLTKFYGVDIAMGSALAGRLDDFAHIEIDLVRVVGRESPERVHVLLGDEQAAKDAAFQSFTGRHAAMLAAYRAGNWAAMEAALTHLEADAGRFGLTRLYEIYRERLAHLAAHPPGQDWDGVYVASEK